MIHSLRGRLLAGLIACLGLAVILAGGFVHEMAKRNLYSVLEHALTDKMRILRSACVQRSGEIEIEISPEMLHRLHVPEDPEFFQIRRMDTGEILLRSDALASEELPPIGADAPQSDPETRFLEMPVWGRCRGVGFAGVAPEKVGEEPAVPLHFVSAHRTERVAESIGRLRWYLMGAGILVMGAGTAVAVWIVSRNLGSLRELAKQIRRFRIDESNIEGRFELANAPSELQPVVNRLNEMMGRVDAALANERQFTANAAHELRTPLAGIRSKIELALSRQRSADEYAETLGEVLKIESWLERLSQNLLLLARLEAGNQKIVTESVDLHRFVARCWKPFLAGADAKELSVSLDVSQVRKSISFPAEMAGIIMRNAFENAVSYTIEKGEINFTAAQKPGGGSLTFRLENGPVVPAQISDEELFRPFSRGVIVSEVDEAHSGIGLALCERVTEALGGKIEIERCGRERFALKIELPLKRDDVS